MECSKCQAFKAAIGELCEYCAHDEKAHPEGQACACHRVSVLGLEFIRKLNSARKDSLTLKAPKVVQSDTDSVHHVVTLH